MKTLFTLLTIIAVSGALLIAFVLRLFATPNSTLHSILSEFLCWLGSAILFLLVASPIDFIPDFIPGLGQVDDLIYFIGAIFAGRSAWKQRAERPAQQTPQYRGGE